MVPLLLVVLAAVPLFADTVENDPIQHDLVDDENKTDRLLGGVSANIEEFPFIVFLSRKHVDVIQNVTYEINCGGTIITENWVLTAAHCLGNGRSTNLPQIEVRGGSSYNDRGGVLRHVTEIVQHNNPPHDIALIKVDEPWPLNGITISIARLPRQDDPMPVGSPAIIMGWRATEAQETRPEILMKQDVVVISHVFCWVSYFWSLNFVNDKQICTLFSPEKTPPGIFKVDSGGPVLVKGDVVGIVLKVSERYALPGYHTRVSSYISWIEENVKPATSAN